MAKHLCQDCLRVVDLEPADLHYEECTCGGDLCSCGSCQGLIGLLESGELDKASAGTIRKILNWTPEQGVTLDQ